VGEQLPDELYQKLVAARQYRAASDMCRQLLFSAVDMHVHSKFDWKAAPASASAAASPTYAPFSAIEHQLSSKMSVLPALPESRFLCAFNHIFAGGYAAGYYSYKWAEVMSADAFEMFVEAGTHRMSIASVSIGV
jgi:oligopeptidase A